MDGAAVRKNVVVTPSVSALSPGELNHQREEDQAKAKKPGGPIGGWIAKCKPGCEIPTRDHLELRFP